MRYMELNAIKTTGFLHCRTGTGVVSYPLRQELFLHGGQPL